MLDFSPQPWTANAAAIRRNFEHQKSRERLKNRFIFSYRTAQEMSLPMYPIKRRGPFSLFDRLYRPHYVNFNRSEEHWRNWFAWRKIKEAIEPLKHILLKRKRKKSKRSKLHRKKFNFQPQNRGRQQKIKKDENQNTKENIEERKVASPSESDSEEEIDGIGKSHLVKCSWIWGTFNNRRAIKHNYFPCKWSMLSNKRGRSG